MSRLSLCFALLLVASPATAQEAPAPERCKIVVLNLVGRALPPTDTELPAILTETLASEVGVVSGCDVVSQTDIVAMLDYEKQKAVCTDGSDSCLAEIGQALGAERVVAGTVGKLGAEYVISARLMNVKKGQVEQRMEAPAGARPEALRRAAKNAGRRLFGAADLPADAKIDDSPIAKGDEGGGSSALFWVGGVTAGVGVVALGVGGAVALIADQRLGDAKETEKQAIGEEGRAMLVVAGVGAAVAVVGAVLLGASVIE
jgi:TolB-like protein